MARRILFVEINIRLFKLNDATGGIVEEEEAITLRDSNLLPISTGGVLIKDEALKNPKIWRKTKSKGDLEWNIYIPNISFQFPLY